MAVLATRPCASSFGRFREQVSAKLTECRLFAADQLHGLQIWRTAFRERVHMADGCASVRVSA